jgi:site-specific DNA recombinase
LLTNVLYVGNITHKGQVHPGEHQGIVTDGLWQQVQDLLTDQVRSKSHLIRNRSGSLLKGLLHCLACGCRMTPTHVTTGGRRYRYYVCSAALKLGRQRCPGPSIGAVPIEQVVLRQLRIAAEECAPVRALLDQGWPLMAAAEQARLVRLLIQRVDYDGSGGKVLLALQARGMEQLVEQLQENQHELVTH